MRPTKDKIHEIAELIDCGNLCFFNKKNGDIAYYPLETDLIFDEEDPWQEMKDKVDMYFDDYIRCEPMDSHHSLRVMENFINTIDSNRMKSQLMGALNKSKPFRNFKHVIDNSGKYRQQWFDYKKDQNIEWIQDLLQR